MEGLSYVTARSGTLARQVVSCQVSKESHSRIQAFYRGERKSGKMVKGQIPPQAFACREQQAAFMLHVTRGKPTPSAVIVNCLPWGAAILSSSVLFHRAEQEVARLL